jgi:serine/threonine protein kinase
LTASGVLIGTPAYVSPERLAGDPATPASDVYATGVVLYEALIGRKAFTADTQLSLAEQIRTGRVPAIHDVLPGVDPSLAQVVERAMATNPSRRFADAGEMRRALESRPVRARRGSVHADADTVPQVVPPTQTQALPTRPRTRRRAPRMLALWLAAAVVVLAALVIGGVVLSQRNTGTTSPPNTTPTTTAAPGAAIPPALDRALDDLSQAIQR